MPTLNLQEGPVLSFQQRFAAVEAAVMADEAVMVSTASTADQIIGGSNLVLSQLATPGAPTVTPSPAGSTNYSYVIVANVGTAVSAASPAGSTSTGPAALSVIAFNSLAWAAVAGVSSYSVYRTVGGTSQGLIATGVTGTTFVDTGFSGDGTTAGTINTSGSIVAGGFMFENFGDVGVTAKVTLTAGQAVNAIVRATAGTDTVTLPTAAAILAKFPGLQVGSTFDLILLNGSGATLTLALGSGITAAAGVTTTLTVASGSARSFLLRVANVATPAITIYGLGTGTT